MATAQSFLFADRTTAIRRMKYASKRFSAHLASHLASEVSATSEKVAIWDCVFGQSHSQIGLNSSVQMLYAKTLGYRDVATMLAKGWASPSQQPTQYDEMLPCGALIKRRHNQAASLSRAIAALGIEIPNALALVNRWQPTARVPERELVEETPDSLKISTAVRLQVFYRMYGVRVLTLAEASVLAQKIGPDREFKGIADEDVFACALHTYTQRAPDWLQVGLTIFAPLAAFGNIEATAFLADALWRNREFGLDTKRALDLVKRVHRHGAAVSKDSAAVAYWTAARIRLLGPDGWRLPSEGIEWLDRAIALGHQKSQNISNYLSHFIKSKEPLLFLRAEDQDEVEVQLLTEELVRCFLHQQKSRVLLLNAIPTNPVHVL